MICYANRSAKLNPYKRDWLPTLIIACLIAVTLTAAHFAVRVNEHRVDLAELSQKIAKARLTKAQQCWTVGGGAEPVVTLCATPWKGY